MSGYYEEKSLSQVCGGGKCLKPKSVLDQRDMEGETPETMRRIRQRGSLALARNMPGPRDLDGRVGEIKEK